MSPLTLGKLTSIRLAPEDEPITAENAPELFDVILKGFTPAPPGTYAPYGYTAQQELRDRLNTRARGEDPGPPLNWKGL